MMIVGRSSFERSVNELSLASEVALDTETTGLRPHHGDRLFSIIMATESQEYYFNFNGYPALEPEYLLVDRHLKQLQQIFNKPDTLWYLHNAKFDMAFLAKEKLYLAGTIHCTLANGRVENNTHMSYSLDASLERIGLAKDSAVDKYIAENKLIEKRAIPGKQTQETIKFYDRVPFDIIVPYGCADARGTFSLAKHQIESIKKQSVQASPSMPTVQSVMDNERRLTHTIFRMEQIGVRVDRQYTVRAARYETDRAEKMAQEYKRIAGRDFKSSSKEFAAIFESDKSKWEYTEKGNPSFDSSVIKNFEHPAAKLVLEIRDAKSKADYYQGFLYHSDLNGDIHPNYNPHGAAHGRFSSSAPNFQNLTSEEGEEEKEFLIRRAIVPRPGFVFIMPDYQQMEYALMFELACRLIGKETPIVKEIKNGKDPHQATADLVTAMGTPLIRARAKTGNFALLYGAGDQRLSETLGGTVDDAKRLRGNIFSVAPEINEFIRTVTHTAGSRGYIFNWLGRRCYFPGGEFAFRAPNYLVAGGCADVVKVAMNRIDDFLMNKISRMVMTVHDEIVCEVAHSELETVPKGIKEILETVFPAQYLPLTTSMEWSDKSLADKKKGFPV